MGKEVIPEYENLGRIDDLKFLFEHASSTKPWKNGFISNGTSCHQFTVQGGTRGISALIAFILLPNWREQLRVTCDFIATTCTGG